MQSDILTTMNNNQEDAANKLINEMRENYSVSEIQRIGHKFGSFPQKQPDNDFVKSVEKIKKKFQNFIKECPNKKKYEDVFESRIKHFTGFIKSVNISELSDNEINNIFEILDKQLQEDISLLGLDINKKSHHLVIQRLLFTKYRAKELINENPSLPRSTIKSFISSNPLNSKQAINAYKERLSFATKNYSEFDEVVLKNFAKSFHDYQKFKEKLEELRNAYEKIKEEKSIPDWFTRSSLVTITNSKNIYKTLKTRSIYFLKFKNKYKIPFIKGFENAMLLSEREISEIILYKGKNEDQMELLIKSYVTNKIKDYINRSFIDKMQKSLKSKALHVNTKKQDHFHIMINHSKEIKNIFLDLFSKKPENDTLGLKRKTQELIVNSFSTENGTSSHIEQYRTELYSLINSTPEMKKFFINFINSREIKESLTASSIATTTFQEE